MIRAFGFGFPKLGEKREFKKLLEGFWKGEFTEEEFLKGMEELNLKRAQLYSQTGDFIPSNELSFYDFMLDTAVTVGAVPSRFQPYRGLETYFEMARGKEALELTKWFNTNYHYLVPELEGTEFRLLENKPLKDYLFFKERGYETVPHVIGLYTFLRLSKAPRRKEEGGLPVVYMEKLEDYERLSAFAEALLPVYKELLRSLKEAGVKRVHFEEPALVLDLPPSHWELVETIYGELSQEGPDVGLFTYYESVSDYERFVNLPVKALHLDLVHGKENLRNLKRVGFPRDKELVAGVVNGRQPWRGGKSSLSLKSWPPSRRISPSLPPRPSTTSPTAKSPKRTSPKVSRSASPLQRKSYRR